MVREHLMGNLWDDYGMWLLDRVEFNKRGYDHLMGTFHNTPFSYLIPLDENRALDGTELRGQYGSYIGSVRVDFGRRCSVLEMLVALALRIECEYIGDPREEHPDLIFWEMICNLMEMRRNGNRCQDANFDQKFVEKRIQIWLNRQFLSDGRGSIFPLKRPQMDQRKVEIWSQMNAYLSENYPF